MYGIVFTLNPPDSKGDRVQVERGKVTVYWSRGRPEKKEERKSEESCGITGKRCDLNKLCGKCKFSREWIVERVKQLTRDRKARVKVESMDGGYRAGAVLKFGQVAASKGIKVVYVKNGKGFTG